MTKPKYWNDATKYLSKKDKKLKKIIKLHDGHLKTRNRPFYSLCKSIIGQQVSVQSADSVWKKLVKKCKTISPNSINSFSYDYIKSCGLTRQKTEYIKLLSLSFLNKTFVPSKLKNLDDEQAIEYLCKNKGIGRWTAEMFLIFSLNRPNIFPIQDIGMLKGISKNYNVAYPPSKEDLNKFHNLWYPYCTVATWYMWRSVDPVPVEY